jgi:ribonuclease P protein subunit RPR2
MPKKRPDRRSKPEYQVREAAERMKILLEKAVGIRGRDPKLSTRYFRLAKKIGMRYNVRMPREYKRKFCRYCQSFLLSGWRFDKGIAKVTCGQCGKTMRYPYKPRKSV